MNFEKCVGKAVTGFAALASLLTISACQDPGFAKEEAVTEQVPPLGKLPELPSEITAPPTPAKEKSPTPSPKAPPASPDTPEPSQAPEAPPSEVTVTEKAPPPAPAPPRDDSSDIRIKIPRELRPFL